MKLTKEYLSDRGWLEKGGIMVLYSSPRLGWKEDGTLIVGYHQHPQKVTTVEELQEVCQFLSE